MNICHCIKKSIVVHSLLLTQVSHTLTQASHTFTQVSHSLTQVSHTLTQVNHTLARVTHAGQPHTHPGQPHTRAGQPHTRAGQPHTHTGQHGQAEKVTRPNRQDIRTSVFWEFFRDIGYYSTTLKLHRKTCYCCFDWSFSSILKSCKDAGLSYNTGVSFFTT